MQPYIKEYEPVRRRLRIKNKLRLIITILLLLLTIITLIIPKNVKGEVNYTEYKVAYGDTYWQIAKDLQAKGYKPRTDIRNIVYELIRKSGIPTPVLREGDIIFIPDLEENQ